MAVLIVQTCDGCKSEQRVLRVSPTGRYEDIRTAAEAEGWFAVGTNLYLCPKCVRNALKL